MQRADLAPADRLLLGCLRRAVAGDGAAPDVDLPQSYYRADRNRPTAPVPLGCIYVLTEGSSPAVASLAPGEAVAALTRQTYLLRFFGDRSLVADRFASYARLVESVPVRKLTVPTDDDSPRDVARTVRRDLARGRPGEG